MTGRIVPVGDSTVRVEFEERIDPAVNARAIGLARALERAAIRGVRDIVPTFRSVNIYFDPLRTDYDALIARLEDEAVNPEVTEAAMTRIVRVPVCYDSEFALDLESVAQYAGMDARDVTDVHTSRDYRVFMLGFMPGFAYMGFVDERIAMPRLPTPRVRVPSGAVAIAGSQTGVYPASGPGGWRVLGRTPLRPFDSASPTPFLFRPGDAVRFYPIDRDQFDAWTDRGWRP